MSSFKANLQGQHLRFGNVKTAACLRAQGEGQLVCADPNLSHRAD